MRSPSTLCFGLASLWLLAFPAWATDRFVSPAGAGIPPYSDWASAATNIQDAIDASAAGDTVWVTNGVYAAGGKVMAGDLTNRVALNKALTVQSVNGPYVTTIQGAWDPSSTTGPLAVRCAWLTNGAVLRGFTLRSGATRSSGDLYTLQSGGGAWCASSNAALANCIVLSNVANSYGGGAYQGNLRNCAVIRNRCFSTYGGGAGYSVLNNCTVVSNSTYLGIAGGVYGSYVTNSIVYFNGEDINGYMAVVAYTCTSARPLGPGNITNAPLLLPDCIHLAGTSPCRGAGINPVSGTDIDGQSWANPPSMGCDEVASAPIIVNQPAVQLTNSPLGFIIATLATGQNPLAYYWTRDGVPIQNDGHYLAAQTPTLTLNTLLPTDLGGYQVVVSNALGMATSAVVQLQLVFHYVDAASSNPLTPYASWAAAATNIQDAIDAALAGEVVLVTNGLYASGGRVIAGDLTNRVALTNAVIVTSVNGPAATVIQGAWDPAAVAGPAAVRCAWLTNYATLNGFTLQGGATRSTGSAYLTGGGGVLGASTNAVVSNCVISNNYAAGNGGGCYRCSLNRCLVVQNSASWGGGVSSVILLNSSVEYNQAGIGAEPCMAACRIAPSWGISPRRAEGRMELTLETALSSTTQQVPAVTTGTAIRLFRWTSPTPAPRRYPAVPPTSRQIRSCWTVCT